MRQVAVDFADLLKPIIDTIDQRGLKSWYLHKHRRNVELFYRLLSKREYHTEVAQGWRRRFERNRSKLFMFLDYDGVPWNNNNAEHAMKAFAYYRRITDGQVKEGPLSDYLVLLSIYQTCKYRGVSFLTFLLSGEEDIEEYCRRGRQKKKGPPELEVYPEGFPRRYPNKKKDQGTRAGPDTDAAGS